MQKGRSLRILGSQILEESGWRQKLSSHSTWSYISKGFYISLQISSLRLDFNSMFWFIPRISTNVNQPNKTVEDIISSSLPKNWDVQNFKMPVLSPLPKCYQQFNWKYSNINSNYYKLFLPTKNPTSHEKRRKNQHNKNS
jgi:hypothetical protein